MLSKKEYKKCQFSFVNSESTSRPVLALKTANFKVLVNYKVLDLQVLFLWSQELSQSNIRVNRYGKNTKTGQNIFM